MARLTDANVVTAREIIGRFPRPKSALIPLLHLAQEQDGYVSEEAMAHIGELVGVTSASLAHDNMRSRGSISENVNFGIRASLVAEIAAAAGADLPSLAISTDNLRRNVVARTRSAVVPIIIHA